jgi:hypothetical protein
MPVERAQRTADTEARSGDILSRLFDYHVTTLPQFLTLYEREKLKISDNIFDPELT